MAGTKKQTGNVLITGASTGIGRACAVHLAGLGFAVFAGVRKEADEVSIADDARKLPAGSGSLHALRMDVTDADTVRHAVQHVSASCGNSGLRALINNAGIAVPGPVEFVTLDDWRRQFEVNLFGQICVTQAALPLLRRAAQMHGSGYPRVVLISSIAGKIVQPILSAYAASKFALEAVGDGLRLELQRQGIYVSVIEPGAIDTPIWKKGSQFDEAIPRGHPAREIYGPEIDAVAAAARKFAASAIPTSRVSKVVAACITRRKPPTRRVVGLESQMGALVKRLIPDRWFDFMIGNALGLPKGNAVVDCIESVLEPDGVAGK